MIEAAQGVGSSSAKRERQVSGISVDSTVRAVSEQVSCDLAGEAVILNLASGVYYGLDHVGAEIWEMLQQPSEVRVLRDAVLERYEVDREQCEADVLDLLREMASASLIEVVDGPAA